MTSTRFSPLEYPLKGEIRVPPDKSMSHRALMFASKASGTSHLGNLLDSLDVRSTVSCLGRLGADIYLSPTDGGTLDAEVTGWGGTGPGAPTQALDCGNSGTTARLLMGLLSGYDEEVAFLGDVSLSTRPMRRVMDPLEQMGARFTPEGVSTLPFTLKGSAALQPISYDSPHASAQVKSAVLLAGLCAEGLTTLTEPAPSRDHTENLLPLFGVELARIGLSVQLEGPQELSAADFNVPGDPSSAAFILAAASLIPGSEVIVSGLSLNTTRLGAIDCLRDMGAAITLQSTGMQGGERVGTVTLRGGAELHGIEVEHDAIPSLIDEIPVLALVATAASGTTVFHGVGELRVKESDRLSAIVEGLSSLGCKAYVQDGEDLIVEGGAPTQDAFFETHADHRLAMTWALAGWCFDVTTTLDDVDCCAVSYPEFIHDIQTLEKGDRCS